MRTKNRPKANNGEIPKFSLWNLLKLTELPSAKGLGMIIIILSTIFSANDSYSNQANTPENKIEEEKSFVLEKKARRQLSKPHNFMSIEKGTPNMIIQQPPQFHSKSEKLHTHTNVFNGNMKKPEMHYVSGLTVYREEFSNSKLIGKYWSANGLIENSKALPDFGIDIPCNAFSLNIDGQSLEWGWEFISASEDDKGKKHHVVLELRHTVRPVSIKVHTEMDGTSFFSRWLEITNTSGLPAVLSSIDVFSGVLASGTAIPSADFQKTPYLLGRFTGNNWAQEGRFVWEPLVNGVITGLQAVGPYGTCGYQCPYFLLSNQYNSEIFAFYLGWSGLWKAEILCDTTLQHMLHLRIGPSAPAPMRILQAGETIVTPKVHIGYLTSDFDRCIQAAHNHIRSSVFLQSSKMQKPLLTFNSAWALGLSDLTEEAMFKDIDYAHELGAEVYMIDAGWYGKASDKCRKSSQYPRLMGDWVPGEWLPRGFRPISERIHKNGMLFGLWIEPESIGLESEIYKLHPNWIVTREGKPLHHVAERLNLDYSNPEVIAWIESELIRIIRDYHIDIIRFDGAPMSAYIGERMKNGHIENIMWKHYELLYGMMDKLVVQFPNLLIENCCGGGGRLDLGILSRSHRTQITDETRIPRIVQILNGISMMLPPEFCVMYTFDRSKKWGGYDVDFAFRVILFTGFYLGGIPSKSPDFQSKLKHYTCLYKKIIAPLLPGCRVYHHTPIIRLEGEKGEAPTPYCVWEYVSADTNTALVGIFKLTDTLQPYHFYPKGLDVGRKYQLTYDNNGSSCVVDGYALQQQGISVNLPAALTSELIQFTVIP